MCSVGLSSQIWALEKDFAWQGVELGEPIDLVWAGWMQPVVHKVVCKILGANWAVQHL